MMHGGVGINPDSASPGISVLAQIVPRFKENPRIVGLFVIEQFGFVHPSARPWLTDLPRSLRHKQPQMPPFWGPSWDL